jgi:nitrite reductase/ring-hydroxylating ferredoxin subunit
MNVFVDVASVDQIAPGTAFVVTVAADRIALFNMDGHLYAVEDSCARCGSSLAAGTLDGTLVSCTCGWKYEVTTGCVNGIPALQVDTFEVKIDRSRVMLEARCVPRARHS